MKDVHKQPWTLDGSVIAGLTGGGKSTFVTRLLRHATAISDPPPEKMTWCCGEWQSSYATMNIPDLKFEEGVSSASLFDPETRNLVIIDDLMKDTDERVTTFFTKESSHEHIRAQSHSEAIPQVEGKSYQQSERTVHGDIQ